MFMNNTLFKSIKRYKTNLSFMLGVVFVFLLFNVTGSYSSQQEVSSLLPLSAEASQLWDNGLSLPSTTLASGQNSLLSQIGDSDNKSTSQSHVSSEQVCDISANVSQVRYGDSVTVYWNTKGFSKVYINGERMSKTSGSKTFHNTTEDTTFILKAKTHDGKTGCSASVRIVCLPPVVIPEPTCTLDINPKTLPHSGGDVTFNWSTDNAHSVYINQGIGKVAKSGTKTVNVSQSKTYLLTAVGEGGEAYCERSVTVEEKPVVKAPTCTLDADPRNLPHTGGQTVLTWTTGNADSVSINQGIGSVALNGTREVQVPSTRTFTLTASGDGGEVVCERSVTVAEITTTPSTPSRSGGGTVVPRCEIYADKTRIQAGDTVELTWETRNAQDIILKDDRGNELIARNSERLNDSETVRPNRTTEYILMVRRGSNDRQCSVKVEVGDPEVIVSEVRDQQPLVSGIALSQVPYTGFEAGPVLTTLFYILLTLWSLFIAYVFTNRKKQKLQHVGASVDQFIQPQPENNSDNRIVYENKIDDDPHFGNMYASSDVAVANSVDNAQIAEVGDVSTGNNIPNNLPVMGYANSYAFATATDSSEVTKLENYAHAHKVLLSGDAMRLLVGHSEGKDTHLFMRQVVATARETYPTEDGWVVLNLPRMRELIAILDENKVDIEGATDSSRTHFEAVSVPLGTGSLAEAIVSGNIVASYKMIASRPIVALADASADLDALYRLRKGENVQVSDLLVEHSKELSDEQIKSVIEALTGALDGVYQDESSAVKMAIMKAVKIVTSQD